MLDGKLEGAKNSSGEAIVQPLSDRKTSRFGVEAKGFFGCSLISLASLLFRRFSGAFRYKFLEWNDI